MNLLDLMHGAPVPVPAPPSPRERGLEAAERAAAHADAVAPGWTDQAATCVEQFAHRRHRLDPPFLLEEARAWAYANGFERPPDDRAWGGVIKRLKRRGVLEHVGAGAAKSSNGSLKHTWRVRR